jgi:hypothetical protein
VRRTSRSILKSNAKTTRSIGRLEAEIHHRPPTRCRRRSQPQPPPWTWPLQSTSMPDPSHSSGEQPQHQVFLTHTYHREPKRPPQIRGESTAPSLMTTTKTSTQP